MLLDAAGQIDGGADTLAFGRVHGLATGDAVLYSVQTGAGVETILHFPTRGRNLLRVQADPLAAHALGVRNLFVTILDDKVGFGLVGDHPWMADTAMFSSDYPHSVSLWPKSAQHIAELTADLDPAATEKILSGTAARIYGV